MGVALDGPSHSLHWSTEHDMLLQSRAKDAQRDDGRTGPDRSGSVDVATPTTQGGLVASGCGDSALRLAAGGDGLSGTWRGTAGAGTASHSMGSVEEVADGWHLLVL
eukprot:scaffold256739_cov31-Tisochrysis_lutea.AAC.2